jgi:Ni/Co efflux regulator RcnB
MRRQEAERRHWQTGQYLPPEYRARRYYVEDWRSRQLPPPAYGYQWQEVDGNYLLIELASGLIQQILSGQR